MGLGQSNFQFQLSIAVIGQTTLNFHESTHEYPSLSPFSTHPNQFVCPKDAGSTFLQKECVTKA